MISLEDLADETLLEILSNLELDNRTLYRLCCTSTRLCGLAQPFLYKSIRFNFPPHESSESILRLHQTFDWDDHYAVLVRRLELNWPQGGPVPNTAKVKIQELIDRLTSLQYLSVRVPHDQRSPLSFLEFAEYHELREVTLDYADITNAMIMKFMFLPKIHQMDIRFLKSLPDPSLPLDCQSGSSPLKILNLGPCTPRECVLGRFLQCPKALETLEFTVPPYSEQFNSSTSTRDFSPAHYGKALSMVRFSLIRLHIHGKFIHRHDGSHLDLCHFSKLRHVSAPSVLFFEPGRLNVSRDGFFRLLPRSLESLEITFPESSWIFKFQYGDDVDEEAMLLTRDNWILELAWNKRMYFPSLSEVTLREAVKDRTSPFAGLQLEIPESRAAPKISRRKRPIDSGAAHRSMHAAGARHHASGTAFLGDSIRITRVQRADERSRGGFRRGGPDEEPRRGAQTMTAVITAYTLSWLSVTGSEVLHPDPEAPGLLALAGWQAGNLAIVESGQFDALGPTVFGHLVTQASWKSSYWSGACLHGPVPMLGR
ncbi:hypothetical protein EG329_001927 [Mollisiaceae sp. DMI_Dod_QoI]|nr:hypothetical protein EG329_001927 [Helotiales sp. DMI_Dod_QoI]